MRYLQFACTDAWSLGVNILNNFTYHAIADIFREVTELFPDPFLCLGGDEPFTGCWYEPRSRSVLVLMAHSV